MSDKDISRMPFPELIELVKRLLEEIALRFMEQV